MKWLRVSTSSGERFVALAHIRQIEPAPLGVIIDLDSCNIKAKHPYSEVVAAVEILCRGNDLIADLIESKSR